jgi:mono/diheme cytochrome c family protein
MSRSTPHRRLPIAAVLGVILVSCATPGTPPGRAPAPDSEATHIAGVYRSRCGACHRPVAPGSEPAGKLHTELLAHRNRTRLSEDDWRGLEALLSAPVAGTAPGTAH